MRKSVTESIVWAFLGLALTASVLALYENTGMTAGDPTDIATTGPFRDGAYLGTLDAKSGKTPHIAVARWSSDSDRKSFIKGYEANYGKTVSFSNQKSGVNRNTVASYRDGLYLGKRDAVQGRAEHAGVGRWAQSQDKELFAFGYHEAYQDKMAEVNAAEQTFRASLVR